MTSLSILTSVPFRQDSGLTKPLSTLLQIETRSAS